MARPLIVEGEAAARMPDLDDAARKVDPVHGRNRACGRRRRRCVDRVGRVGGEGVLDVGQHQFLVLLLVMQAELDQGHRIGGRRFPQQLLHGQSTWAR